MEPNTAVYANAIEPEQPSAVQEQGKEQGQKHANEHANRLTTAVHLKAIAREPTSPEVVQIGDGTESVARPPPATEPAFAGLCAATVVDWDGQGDAVTLRFADVECSATLHPSVEPVVIRRAIQRGELAIVQRQSAGWQVIGVLRTSATPGLDVGDDYAIEARRVTLRAEHELVLTSGAARLALAAFGRIESIARQITSRASAVHKIIGRVIQLN